MQPKILKSARGAFFFLMLLFAQQSWSQCTNTTSFGSAAINTSGAVVTISTCSFAGEYSTITGAVNGQTLRFTSSIATDVITVREGSSSGPVAGGGTAFGTTPLTFVNTFAGTLYAHWNTPGCGSQSTCRTTTVQCTSCTPPPAAPNDLCTGAINIDCGQSISSSTSGQGTDAAPTCGTTFGSAPGVWYGFTGDGTTVTLSLCGSGFDTKLGVFTGSCAVLTCVAGNDDFCGLQSQVTFAATNGTNYFVLVTGFGAGAGAFTLARTCVAPDPCASIPTLSCATPVTASPAGAGAWSPNSCGFFTPGQERVYSFTPLVSGNHTLVVTAASGGFGDYFYKAASGGCNNAGWTCIGDANAPESNVFGPLTAGTNYYILFDPEITAAVSHTFRIDCPIPVTPPCVLSPTSPTNGQTNICPSATQTLSWPVSAGATSYDVYFGTNANPPFVGNTVATSFVASTPTTATYYWQIRPRNAAGATAGCNIWSFTKIDNTLPTITCPASVTTNNSPATACSAVVTYGAISATDNCVAPTIALIGGLASGATYPVGVTTNIYRATDGVGNSSACSFTVTVKDVTLPTITCPANIVRASDLGLCGTNVSYTAPIATDNCAILSVTQVNGLASGAFNPVGVTTNIWRATDVNNNFSTCSFTVTVTDNEKPTAICPPDRSVYTDYGQCASAINNTGGLQVSDNCFVASTSNNAPSPYPVGQTVVTWTVTDLSGNTQICTQLITVTDGEPPIVFCPGNIIALPNEGNCEATVDFMVSSTDNCGVVSTDISNPSSSDFPVGITYVQFSATDAGGNYSSCVFQVTVKARPEICNNIDDDCDGWVDEAEDWVALVKRFASDGAAAEEYGVSVDIDGDYAIVGSNQKNATGQSVGSAYILFRDKSGDNKWGQVIELIPPASAPGDNFGASVAISGGVAAVGAPFFDDQFANQGVVFLFYQNANNPEQWDFVKILHTSDPAPADNFGASVALDGDRLLAGCPLNDESGSNAGAAYAFYRNLGGADNWGQQAKLIAITGAANDNMGVSVALDGDYAIVGANGVDGLFQNAGAAYIFGRNQFGPDAWGQVTKIRANQAGQNDNFGASVGISGPWAIVGADANDLKGTDAGAAFIFYKNQNGILNSWGQRQIVLDYNGQAGDHFGSAVGMDEPYAVVAAKGDNPFGAGSGRGFVYLLDGSAWVLVSQLTDGGGQAEDALGTTAAISGRNIILGAPLDNNGSNNNQGAVMVYGGLCDDELNPEGDNRDDFNVNSESSVRCFPVPFSDVLNIELKGIQSADAQLTIVNAMGQIVADLYKGSIEGDMLFQWQPTQSADGLYFLRMITGAKVVTQAIVRNR